jgi:hypothetical protein
MLTCSGEVLHASTLADAVQALPRCVVLNLYGLTEVAADCTCAVVHRPTTSDTTTSDTTSQVWDVGVREDGGEATAGAGAGRPDTGATLVAPVGRAISGYGALPSLAANPLSNQH